MMTPSKRGDERPAEAAGEAADGQEADDFGAEKFAQLIRSFLGGENEAP